MTQTQAELSFSLDDKYRQEEGTILLSGVQALARLPLDQHRADKRRGLNTAGMVSGYRGSPLGGLDLLLQREKKLFDEHQIVFVPGVNEDLGATAVFGSQLANLFPKPKYDGVIGMWYGKGPGVDRTGDVFKHANYAGVGRYGGVLALAGDDPVAKSSTIPSHSEVALYDALIPVLYPGNVQEILDYGRLGFELSRYSGLWVGFKIVTNVADSFGSAVVSPERIKITDPGFTYNGRPWQPTQSPNLIAPYSLGMEQELQEGRLEAAKVFAAANGLNRITVASPGAWLGIVAAGKSYYDLKQALSELGLDETALTRYGIRLLKVGMLFPLEPGIVTEFAQGLEEILVIEEKRAFVELFLRDILYNLAERPRVVGKRDSEGQKLIPAYGELDADQVAALLVKRLESRLPAGFFTAYKALAEVAAKRTMIQLPMARQSYFCSGCPHNRSTVVPEGSMAAAGIGCSGMALSMNRNTTGITHMGGEGVQWVGASPFTDTPHMFQNLGDGTLFHSGSLAIRQAIAAEVNITYKILYNSAVAMTGGQVADGAMPVPDLTHALIAEGVRRIIVTTDQPDKYPEGTRWPEGVEVWHRDRLDEAQKKLRDEKGVTILIHDQMCAAELRRQRKRGKIAEPVTRVLINEAVCEGCGDCGVKSNCLSVQPVETEFGRKTQIHQSSCNKDYSCLNGDCPSFLTVIPQAKTTKSKAKTYRVEGIEQLPDPVLKVGPECNVYMVGIGGTGVVTINQILGTAALLDGKYSSALDQTGLSQKGGPVASHLKIMAQPREVSSKIGAGETDCYLGFDILTAAAASSLGHTRQDRTIAIISTGQIPTGAMVTSTEAHFPGNAELMATINKATRPEDNVYLDALHLSETFFGDHMPANLIVVGAAFQTGALPLSAAAIEKAIKLNGAGFEKNTEAFRLGRKLVAQPEWAATLVPQRNGSVEFKPVISPVARKLIDSVGASGELQRLLEIRVPELIAYQNAAYARSYVKFVEEVVKAERKGMPGQTRLSEAAARYLFKLMAYKDEYEVARLHLRPEARQAIEQAFGKNARVQYQLHPPFMRALGLQNKIKLGQWFDPFFGVLVKLKSLRGTPLDLFGYSKVRRTERALVGEYRQLIEARLSNLSGANYEQAVKLANLPDLIRGYEEIKLRNVARFREQAILVGLEKVREIKEASVRSK